MSANDSISLSNTCMKTCSILHSSSEHVRYFTERVLDVRSDQKIKNAFDRFVVLVSVCALYSTQQCLISGLATFSFNLAVLALGAKLNG